MRTDSKILIMKKTNSETKLPVWTIVLWIGAALANIKSIFADYDVDLSYAVVTSYRHLSGEKMFMEMREPHQTSAYILDGLMWLFHKVTGSYEGVVIFVNIFGVLLFALLSCFLVKTLKRHTDHKTAHLIGIAIFAFRARQIVMPEFTNMLFGFSVLLVILLINHFEKENDRKYLILSAITLCLMVLSYPSAVVAYLIVCFLIFKYSSSKKRDICLLAAVCAAAGICYVILFSVRAGGLGAFLHNLLTIVSGDSAHTTRYNTGLLFYLKEMIAGCVWIASSAAIAFAASSVYRILTKKNNKNIFWIVFGSMLIVIDLTFCVFYDDVVRTASMRYVYGNISILLIVMGFCGFRYCSDTEKKIWIISLLISLSNILSVVLLTNMELITAVQYIFPAGAISIIPANRLLGKNDAEDKASSGYSYVFSFIAVLLVILHRGIVIRDYSGACSSILGIEGMVKNGPAKGVVCSYMSAYMTKCNEEDWMQFISPGENVLVVGTDLYDPIVYCFNSSSVSHYSTIDTPTYDETLLGYWDTYPDKYPDVIAVECWYGDMHVEEDSWIMQWVYSNSDCVGDGRYFRFYRVR